MLCALFSVVLFSCTQKEDAENVPPPGGPYPAILVAQAQFNYVEKNGKRVPVPGPAVLTIKQKIPAGWHDTVLEDPQSNVFHKAVIFEGKILTVGAMKAALKLWQFTDGSWQQQVLWDPVFGGTWDRLRDVEIGDVTGDGKADLLIATHDQGVVAVAVQQNRGWDIQELSREPGIFVHEIEAGDVDGDGIKEFFATPSQPNKAKGGPQPGSVVMYTWNGKGFERTVVDRFEKTHAKEILVASVGHQSPPRLFSVIEAETKREQGRLVSVTPVKIKMYSFKNKKAAGRVIATLDDLQCRFLTAGDVDGDGATELVAAAMKSGIWMIKQEGTAWKATSIDADSSGYEHACCIDDLDGDGTREIYVASDDQQELRVYRWNGTGFSKTVLSPIHRDRITWNLTTGSF